ncbi:MAG: DUF177 domain-containing protein [Paludibacteraceae bacterium]|nr:DUF177 domain-containing protein [Paludibacteraceae bacterium]
MDNIIDLNKLELGTHVYDFQLDSAYLSGIEKSELLGGNVTVKAELDLRPASMLLHVWVDGTVQVTCDRCLDSMDIAMSADDDMEIESDAQSIDLNWLAYELIVVNLPIVHFHNPGDCNPQMDALLQQHLRSTLAEPENAS